MTSPPNINLRGKRGSVRPPRGAHMEYTLLNALRGLAALAVVPFHVVIQVLGVEGWDGWQIGAYSAVAFFFVLTGFGLTIAHRSEWERGWTGETSRWRYMRLRRFAIKRFVRLFPLYWIVTGAVVVAATALPGAMDEKKFAVPYLLQSFLAWPPFQTLPILPQAWTNSVVVKAYFLFSLAFLFTPRTLRWIGGAFVIGVVANSARHWYPPGMVVVPLHYLIDFMFHPLTLHFVWGVVAAVLVQNRQGINRPTLTMLIGVIGFVAVLAAALWRVIGNYEMRMFSYGLASGVLVFALAQYELQKDRRAPQWLLRLGEASYALYITHVPVTVVLTMLLQRLAPTAALDRGAFLVFQVGVCVFVGLGTHQFLEVPLTRLLSKRWLSSEHRSSTAHH